MNYSNYDRKYYITKRLNFMYAQKNKIYLHVFLYNIFKFLYKNLKGYINLSTILGIYKSLKIKPNQITKNYNLCWKLGRSKGFIRKYNHSRFYHRSFLNKGLLNFVNTNNSITC